MKKYSKVSYSIKFKLHISVSVSLKVLYFIVYRYLFSASHGVSQTKALSVHFSSRKKVRLNARRRRGKGSKTDVSGNKKVDTTTSDKTKQLCIKDLSKVP